MSSWKGKTRGGVLGYKIFIYTVKYLGLPTAYFVLRFVSFYYFLFSPQSFRYGYFYFHRVLKFNALKSFYNIYKNYYVFGQVLIDKNAMMADFKTKLTFDFDGEDNLRKMTENKTGGLLISAHVGNFEIAGSLLKRLNTKANIVMLEAEHQRIKEFLSQFVKSNDTNIISIKDDFSHIYEINKALENNEILCIHGDRFLKDNKTITAKFFGRDAKFPSGPFYLALKYNIPVSFVFAMKETKYHYHFYASPQKYYYQTQLNSRNRDTFIKAIIQDYISELEKILLKYPSQWFNYYNFWEEQG